MQRLFVSVGLVIAALPALAENMDARSPRTSLAFESDSPYVQPCVSMFIARIFPGQILGPGVGSATHERQGASGLKLHASQPDQEVAMFARSKKDNSLLAIGSCSVSRNGQIMNVSVRTISALQLARLQPADVELAMTRR